MVLLIYFCDNFRTSERESSNVGSRYRRAKLRAHQERRVPPYCYDTRKDRGEVLVISHNSSVYAH